jgi:hypothetical protein
MEQNMKENAKTDKSKPRGGRMGAGKVDLVPIDGLSIDWNAFSGKWSVYKAKLEELLETGPGSGLLIEKESGRAQVNKRARELGVKVKFGRLNGQLYAKIVPGSGNHDALERVAGMALPPKAAQAGGASLLIRSMLAKAPRTCRDLARVLGVSAASCSETLDKLVEDGSIRNDAGVYSLREPPQL